MSKVQLTINEIKIAKSGKGLSFSWDGKNAFISWIILAPFKITKEKINTLKSFEIEFDPKKNKRMYSTYMLTNIDFLSANWYKLSEIKAPKESEGEEVPFEKEFSVGRIALDPYQNKALKMVMEKPISIITGFAGTGKSSTVRIISEQLEKDGWLIFRVAPTGKASKVISGSTIHSWLLPIVEIIGGEVTITGYKRDKMTEDSCLIVDESSMLDDELWGEIKKVWNNSKNIANKKIIFVGDHGQLRPVGEGEPFLNAIENKMFPITELKTIHRTKNNNEIVNFVNKIRTEGVIDHSVNYKNIEFISEEQAYELVASNPDYQMIAPRRNGDEGTLEINKVIRAMIKNNEKLIFHTTIFSKKLGKFVNHSPIHINDKIIITKNLWEWDVTNGTTAIMKGKEKVQLFNHVRHTSRLTMCYKFLNTVNNEFFYLPANREVKSVIELAYAITIHKAQGSEYDHVIIFLNGIRINQRMIYTAVTRAKKTIKIVL